MTLKPAVVILAAGASTRMGCPKMLLPWGGTTVLGHLIRSWSAAGAGQIAVVMAAENAGINQELDRLQFPRSDRIINPAPQLGMFSSIQCAARWAGWNDAMSHWAIVLGDQPHLRLETLQGIIRFAAFHPGAICQPAWLGRARHPVLLPKELFLQLAVAEVANLRDFLGTHRHRCRACETDDSGLDQDMDTPADYERLAKLHAGTR